MAHSPLPDEFDDLNTVVLGKTRAGKSTALRGRVEYHLRQEHPVGIIDPKGDWWGIKLSASGKRSGFPIIIFGGEHADVPINEHSGAAVAELFATGNRSCLIDLGGWMPGPRTRFWIDFASTLFRMTRGSRYLVIDEVHNFAPKGKIMDPDAGKSLHWTNRLASEGLGKGLRLMIASQRPQKVHNDTLTSCEGLIAMRVLHKADRDAVSDWIKGCGDAVLGNEVLSTLGQMKRGEGWAWNAEIQFGPKRIHFPMFGTYDSFKPQSVEEVKGLTGWAAVDLEDVKKKLAAAVEEAKANDPKELKKHIEDLEAEIRGMRADAEYAADPVVAGHSDADLDAARQTGHANGFAEGHARGYLDGQSMFRQEWEKKISEIDNSVMIAATNLNELWHSFRAAEPKPLNLAPTVHADYLDAVRPIVAPRIDIQPRAKNAPLPAVASTPKVAAAPHEGVTPSQQRILDALAWLESIRVTAADRSRLAWMSDTTPKSSGFLGNLGAMARNGLVQFPGSSSVQLTAAGRAKANKPRAALTDADLRSRIREKLTDAQKKLMDEALKAHPHSMSRATLAERSGTTPSSSGFLGNLGTLKTLGILQFPTSGQVAAGEGLFVGNR